MSKYKYVGVIVTESPVLKNIVKCMSDDYEIVFSSLRGSVLIFPLVAASVPGIEITDIYIKDTETDIVTKMRESDFLT